VGLGSVTLAKITPLGLKSPTNAGLQSLFRKYYILMKDVVAAFLQLFAPLILLLNQVY